MFDDNKISDQKTSFKNFEGAIINLAEGKVNKTALLKLFFPNFGVKTKVSKKKIVDQEKTIKSLKGISHTFANCCKPTSDTDNIGYLSGHHVIRIHKRKCKRIKLVDPKRLLELE